MATAKIKKISPPKVATKTTKVARISTGSVSKPSAIKSISPKNVAIPKSSIKSMGLVKAPSVKIGAPKVALTKPKVYIGQKPNKG